MVRNEMVLQAFLSSPGDLLQERQLVEDVVEELNATWSRSLGIRLELLRWERDAPPDAGDTAQAVVDQAIGEDYDLFIGILGARFGTPTGDHGSGTEAEFERALKRKRETGEPRLMLYFGDIAVPLNEIDPEQLSLVQAFRDRAGESGVLYGTFRTTAEFEQLLRLHLSKVVQSWQRPPDFPERPVVPQGADDEEPGLLDLLENVEDQSALFEEVAERMSQAVTELGERLETRTGQLQQIEPGQQRSLKVARLIITGTAADLNRFVASMEGEIPLFRDTYAALVEPYTQLLDIMDDFGGLSPGQMQEMVVSSESLHKSITESHRSIAEFRDSLASLPRISKVMNQAKRSALKMVEQLLTEIESAENITREIHLAFLQADDQEPST